jgi:DNA-binding MarR family transcriptional regulator
MGMAIRTVDQGPVPLTVAQHRVLVLVEEAGSLSVNGVADRLGVNQSNASRHCTRLVDLGLLHRRPSDDDRRSVDLRLTTAGNHQIMAVRQARRQWAADVLTQLPAEQAHAVVRGMELLAAAAVEAIPAEHASLL